MPNAPMSRAVFCRFDGRDEAGVERGDDRAQHDQQQERRELFFHVVAIL